MAARSILTGLARGRRGLRHRRRALVAWLVGKLGPPAYAVAGQVNGAEWARIAALALSSGAGMLGFLQLVVANATTLFVAPSVAARAAALVSLAVAVYDYFRRLKQGMPSRDDAPRR